MGISLWIPTSLQYVTPPITEGRRKDMARSIAEAVKHYFFEYFDDGQRDQTNTRHPEFNYPHQLQRFANSVGYELTCKNNSSVEKLWHHLKVTLTQEPQNAALSHTDQSPKGVINTHIEILFMVTVHALCLALGEQTQIQDGFDDQDMDDDDDDDDDPLAPEYITVLHKVSAELKLFVAGWLHDQQDADLKNQEALQMISKVALDAVLTVLNDWFEVRQQETPSQRKGKPHTSKTIHVRNPELEQRIQRLLQELPLSLTLQPLRQPVTYAIGAQLPSNVNDEPHTQLKLVDYRHSNAFLRKIHGWGHQPLEYVPEFSRYVDAVNIQQQVPWRVNRDLLTWVHALIQCVDPEHQATPGLDVDTSAVMDARTDEALLQWVSTEIYEPNAQRKTLGKKGEFLDHPSARHALKALVQLDEEGGVPAFYLPWKADYRGRIYPETPWLSPQGGDLQRALLEFHHGQVLNVQGITALRRHGANLVESKEEGEKWVLEQENKILASAAAPLKESFWRECASKKKSMQFLAFCLAYRQWKLDPSTPIHLPVQIDGTSNGLQHIAALTGDENLARSVNVLPREDGMRADIYSELADTASRFLQDDSPTFKGIHKQGLAWAHEWLMISQYPWLNRDVAKKVVMTIPYGASSTAQAEHVALTIHQQLADLWQTQPPSAVILNDWVDWKEQRDQRKQFVRKCTRDLFINQEFFRKVHCDAFNSDPKVRDAADSEIKMLLRRTEWEQLRTFVAYVALALVEYLRRALHEKYPKVGNFSKWLQDTAQACAGSPLFWIAPNGFVVCQDKFKMSRTTITAHLRNQKKILTIIKMSDEVGIIKQENALLPNLIHSLDATHLTWTLVEARKQGITHLGSIHDCFLCPPNDSEHLGHILQQTFARLYEPQSSDISAKPLPISLLEWWKWMEVIKAVCQSSKLGSLEAAMEYPGCFAERYLQVKADQGYTEDQATLRVLDIIRQRNNAERNLLFILVQYLRSVPEPTKPLKRKDEIPTPPCSALTLGPHGQAMSPYFFS